MTWVIMDIKVQDQYCRDNETDTQCPFIFCSSGTYKCRAFSDCYGKSLILSKDEEGKYLRLNACNSMQVEF